IRIEVLLTVISRIRVAPTPLYLKRSPEGEEFSGRLFVWDTQEGDVELETIEVGPQPLTWSVAAVPGKKVITLVAKPGKLRPQGTAPITLKIKKPCSQAIPLEVRW